MSAVEQCSKGHLSDVLNSGRCKECISEQNEVQIRNHAIEKSKKSKKSKQRRLKRQKNSLALQNAVRIVKHHARRAKEHPLGIGHNEIFTHDDIVNLMQEQNCECIGCFVSFDEEPFEVDHIKALSAGGKNTPDNIQLLCNSCNLSKGNRHNVDWLSEMRYRQVMEYLEYFDEEGQYE